MRSPSVSPVIFGQLASATKLRHLKSTKWQPPFWISSPHWRPKEGRRALPSHQLPFIRKEVFPQNTLPHPLPTHTPVDFCLYSFDQIYVIWGPLVMGVEHWFSIDQPISSGCHSKHLRSTYPCWYTEIYCNPRCGQFDDSGNVHSWNNVSMSFHIFVHLLVWAFSKIQLWIPALSEHLNFDTTSI